MDGADQHFPRFAAAYGLAHFGKSLFWSCSEGLFVFYLTEICRLSPGRAGLVMGVALQFSAIADLLLLRLCRRQLIKPDGALRLQAVGAMLTSVFFLLFSLTAWVPSAYRLGAALIGSLAFRGAYAALDVPQNALMGLVPDTAPQRTRLASVRMAGSGLAALSVSGLAYYMISGVGAVTTGVAAGLIGLISVIGATLTLKMAPRPSDIRAEMPPVLWRKLITASTFWILAAGTLGAVASTMLSKLVPYFAAYGLQSASAGGLLMAAVALGGVLSQPFWIRLGGRRTRRGMIEANSLILLGASILFYPASLAGLWASVPCAFIQGAGLGGLGQSVWAGLGDEARAGHGDSAGIAFLFALLTFLSKSALAAAALILTFALKASSYRSSQSVGDWPLLPLMCLCPILIALLCLCTTRLLRQPRNVV